METLGEAGWRSFGQFTAWIRQENCQSGFFGLLELDFKALATSTFKTLSCPILLDILRLPSTVTLSVLRPSST